MYFFACRLFCLGLNEAIQIYLEYFTMDARYNTYIYRGSGLQSDLLYIYEAVTLT